MLTKRHKELVLFFVVIITLTSTASYLLVKGYLYPFIINSTQKAIKEITGRNILIGSVEISFFPPKISLKDFTAMGEDKDNLRIIIAEITARLNPLQALSGTIIINDLIIKSPNLYLKTDYRGIPEMTRFMEPGTSLKPSFFKVDIRNIRIIDGNFTAQIENQGALELRNTFINFNRDNREISPLDIRVKSGEVRFRGVTEPLSDLSIDGALSDGKLDIQNISVYSKDLSVRGHGLFHFKDKVDFKGTVRAKVPSQRIIRYLKESPEITGDMETLSDIAYDKTGWKIKSDVAISKGTAGQFSFKRLKADLTYTKGRLGLKTAFTIAESDFKFNGKLSVDSGLYQMEGTIDKIAIPWPASKKVVLKDGLSVSIKGEGNIKKPSYRGTVSALGKGVIPTGENQGEFKLSVKGDLALEGDTMNLKLSEDIEGELSGVLSTARETGLFASLSLRDLSKLSLLIDLPMKGQADVSGNIKGTFTHPAFDGNVTLWQFSVNGRSFKKISGDVKYSGDLIASRNLKIEGETSIIDVEGTVALKPKPVVDLSLSLKDGELSELMTMAGVSYPVHGDVEGAFRIKGSIKDPFIDAIMEAKKIKSFHETFDTLFFSGEYAKDRIHIRNLLVQMGTGSLVASGTIETQKDMELSVRMNDVNPGDFQFIKGKIPGLEGKIRLDGKLTGKSSTPMVDVEIRVDQLGLKDEKIFVDLAGNLTGTAKLKDLRKSRAELAVHEFEFSPPGYKLRATAPFTVTYRDEGFIVDGLSTKEGKSSITLNGKIALNGLIDLAASGETEVSGLKDYLKGVENIGGSLAFDSTIKGSLKNYGINATLRTSDGMVRFPGFPYDLKEIRGTLTLTKERLTVNSLEGRLQEARFTGGGTVSFKNFQLDETDLFFDIDEVGLRYPSWLSSRGKGRITVTARGADVTLGGDIEIMRAIYAEDFDLKKMMKKTERGAAPADKETAKKNKLNFNLHFRADDNLLVKNDVADIEMRGYLTLIGQPRRLSLLGEIEAIGGRIFFRNREFSIVRGGVNFSNEMRIDPYFDIEAETDVKDYHVNLEVSGSRDDYKLYLSSNPPLEEREIVSLLVLGHTGSELKTSGTEMTSIEAVSLLLQGELEEKVKKIFGFDRFQIDPYYSEYSGSTEARITVGKELREDLTATYSRGLSSLQEEQLTLEYRLDDNLSLMGSWTSQEEQVGTFGGDVILRFEFR